MCRKRSSKDQESTWDKDAVGKTSRQSKKLCRRALDFEPKTEKTNRISSLTTQMR